MRFSLPSIKCSEGPPSLRLLPSPVRCLNCAQRFDYRSLCSSRKLGGAGEHLIDGSENAFVGWALNFRVRMLLKGAVNIWTQSASIHSFFITDRNYIWTDIRRDTRDTLNIQWGIFRHSKEKMKHSWSRLPSPASAHASALLACGGGVQSITLFEFIFCQYSCWTGRSRENHANLPPSYLCKRLSIRFGVSRNLTLKINRQGSNQATVFCIVSFDFNWSRSPKIRHPFVLACRCGLADIRRFVCQVINPRGRYSREFWIGVCRKGSSTLSKD